jgi:hypothetical protein
MRNNLGVAQKETAPSKAFMGILKKAVEAARLPTPPMRATASR